MFDCEIIPVKFSFWALLTILVKLLENPRCTSNLSEELLMLEYRIPNCKPNDKIQIVLFLEETTIVLAV